MLSVVMNDSAKLLLKRLDDLEAERLTLIEQHQKILLELIESQLKRLDIE